VQNAIRKVNEDLARLQKEGPDSAEALKAVANGLNGLMGLGKQRKGKVRTKASQLPSPLLTGGPPLSVPTLCAQQWLELWEVCSR
jgi:hypothetical protein